ncbi:MAG TPA: hypothetical protein VGJ57_01425 [Nitrospirales bacterium]
MAQTIHPYPALMVATAVTDATELIRRWTPAKPTDKDFHRRFPFIKGSDGLESHS